MQIHIIHWSGTGNTRAMANLIGEGAQSVGASVKISDVSEADGSVLDADVLVLGCPSMGDEVLEEGEFEPFITSIEGQLNGKKLALFGSYGWGDGQWMRDWTKRMADAGAVLAAESLIVNEAPDDGAAAQCKAFGAALAE
jgi:flavodoxin short chain